MAFMLADSLMRFSQLWLVGDVLPAWTLVTLAMAVAWAAGCCGANAAWKPPPGAWRPSFPNWAAT